MKKTTLKSLRSIAAETQSLRATVAKTALDSGDAIDFLQNLDRFRCGEAFLSIFGESATAKYFFDGHCLDIWDTLAEMHAAGDMPDFSFDGDLRGSLSEAAFLFVADELARECGLTH